MAKKCLDYIEDLHGFIDGDIEPELCAEIEKHIGHCHNCRIMVDSLKATVRLVCDDKEAVLPKQLETKLNALLKDRWNKKFGRQDSQS